MNNENELDFEHSVVSSLLYSLVYFYIYYSSLFL